MAKKPAQLHELLAVEASLTNTAKTIFEETMNTFVKRQDHFRGQTRVLTYLDDDRSQENERETKNIITTVSAKLEHTIKPIEKIYDALLQKEEANQRARADLTVNGVEIGKDLPATFLLGLETRLAHLRNVLLLIPTLDPSYTWKEEVNGQFVGTYTSNSVKTKRTEKTIKSKVLYEATKEHPAQIQQWSEDVVVATIETSHISGMWMPTRKSKVLENIDSLIRAVKQARQRANTVEVSKDRIAGKLLDFILAE